MRKFLEKVGWRMRKLHFKVAPLYISIEATNVEISLFKVQIGFEQYNLFLLDLYFPNKTTVQRFYIYAWDVLFLRTFLLRYREDLDEKNLWTSGKLSYLEHNVLKLLNKIL